RRCSLMRSSSAVPRFQQSQPVRAGWRHRHATVGPACRARHRALRSTATYESHCPVGSPGDVPVFVQVPVHGPPVRPLSITHKGRIISELKVLVVGAGLGGLTLAQSLRGHGIDVAVFERDAGPWDRPQGYRLHLDADAINAAREVLPAQLYAVLEATAQYTEPFTTILGTDLSVLKRLPARDDHGQVWPAHDGPASHANVDRATLRQILLAGLEDAVHFGKTVQRYEDTADGVTAYFTDGST